MAVLYWNPSAEANFNAANVWSLTDGGTANQTFTNGDTVHFTSSNNFKCNLTANATVAGIDFNGGTGYAGTFAHSGGAIELVCTGNVNLTGPFSYTYASSSVIRFRENGSHSLVNAGKTIPNLYIGLFGTPETITLNLSENLIVANSICFYLGTFNTNGYTITASKIAYASPGGNRDWNFANSTINISTSFEINNTAYTDVYDFANTVINMTGSNNYMDIYKAITLPTVNATGGGVFTLALRNASSVITNFSRVGTNAVGNGFALSAEHNNSAIVGNTSFSCTAYSSSQLHRVRIYTLLTSSQLWYEEFSGKQVTLTINAASPVFEYCDFKNIVAGGSFGWNLEAITGLSGDGGNNSGIIFTSPQNNYWVSGGTGSLNWSDASKWKLSDHTTPGRVPLLQDTPIFDSSSFDSNYSTTLVLNSLYYGRLDFTGATKYFTLSMNSATRYFVHGSIIFNSYLYNFLQPSYIFLLQGQDSSLNFSNIALTALLYLRHSSTITAQNNLEMSSYVQMAGTFDLNTYNLKITSQLALNTQAGVTYPTFNAGTGTITIEASSGDVFVLSSNATFNCSTSTIVFSKSFSSGTANVNLNEKILYNLSFTGKATSTGYFLFNQGMTVTGTLRVDGANQFKIAASKTITLGPNASLDFRGSAGNLIKLTAQFTSAWYISRPSGTQIFETSYLDLSYSNAVQSNTFYAPNSTNSGNNVKWIFGSASTNTNFLLFFF